MKQDRERTTIRMRSLILTALLAAVLSCESNALQILPQRGVSPAVVGLDIQRKHVQDPIDRDALRRRQTVTESLDNEVHCCIVEYIESTDELYREHFTLPT